MFSVTYKSNDIQIMSHQADIEVIVTASKYNIRWQSWPTIVSAKSLRTANHKF